MSIIPKPFILQSWSVNHHHFPYQGANAALTTLCVIICATPRLRIACLSLAPQSMCTAFMPFLRFEKRSRHLQLLLWVHLLLDIHHLRTSYVSWMRLTPWHRYPSDLSQVSIWSLTGIHLISPSHLTFLTSRFPFLFFVFDQQQMCDRHTLTHMGALVDMIILWMKCLMFLQWWYSAFDLRPHACSTPSFVHRMHKTLSGVLWRPTQR
jgi:hypothetical protein